jgi:hypothetical protein
MKKTPFYLLALTVALLIVLAVNIKEQNTTAKTEHEGYLSLSQFVFTPGSIMFP